MCCVVLCVMLLSSRNFVFFYHIVVSKLVRPSSSKAELIGSFEESCTSLERQVKEGCRNERTCNRCTVCSTCLCEHGFIRKTPEGGCVLLRECLKERVALLVEEHAANSLETHISQTKLKQLFCNVTETTEMIL